MSAFRRALAVKKALNFISGEVSPYSSCGGFRNIRILGGVSIPRPPPSRRPHFFSRGFAGLPQRPGHDPLNWTTNPSPEQVVDGCDFKHWFIVVDPPEGNPTRDEIIDCYVKTLATVVGSEEEAKKKIYAVSTKHYFAFQCLISYELSQKLEPLPNVRWVLPDSYVDPRVPDYGGEPFINGQAVPYDPKYHAEWVRNNARCNERRSSAKVRNNNDQSRNFERRRDVRQNPGEMRQNFGERRQNPGEMGQNPGEMRQNFGERRPNPGEMGQNFGERRPNPGEMGQNFGERRPNDGEMRPNAYPHQNDGEMRPNAYPRQNDGEMRPNAYPRQIDGEMRPNAYPRQNDGEMRPNAYPRQNDGEMRPNSYQHPPPNSPY